jgi:hypothetical protein
VEGKSIREASTFLFQRVLDRVTCESENTYVLPYRGDLDPLTTWRGGFGDEIDVSILTCAILRSVGIPSRLVYTPAIRNARGGKVWLEFMDEQKQWIPWVPTLASLLKTKDHKAALQVLMKDKGGIIFANPADPEEITESYLPTVTLDFTQPRGPAKTVEHNLSFQVDSRLKPIRGYELISISTQETERRVASDTYWSFTVIDDLSVSGEKTHRGTLQGK